MVVELEVRRGEGEGGFENQLSYRAIQWHEVKALAGAEDVELAYTEDRATLTFPVLE